MTGLSVGGGSQWSAPAHTFSLADHRSGRRRSWERLKNL